MTLKQAWAKRNRLWAEGNKFRAKSKLRADGIKFWAEGNKNYAEGYRLRAEGDIIFLNAVIATHGNIKIEWKNWNSKKQSCECHLETGEVFKP